MSDVHISQEAPICITAPVVTGSGDAEVLQRLTLDLPALLAAAAAAGLLPFAGFVADAVVLTKRVEITSCEVFTNKVLINGVLHKDVLLKVAPVTPVAVPPGTISPADCALAVAMPLDLIIDCPFGACITVPGACPGDTCQIERACVDAERETLISTPTSPFPTTLEEKVCIRLAVKAIRNRQVTILPVEPNICPGAVPEPVCPPTGCLDTGLRSATRVVTGTGATP